MGLLTVDELEDAMGGISFTEVQTNTANYLINRVSSYLESATGVTFEPVVGFVFRSKADSNGEIRFPVYPVTDVSNFHDFKSDLDITYPRWDGLELLLGFFPSQVVDVTIDYGMTVVPADIKNVATEAVRRGMSANSTTLVSKTVGDVIYQFGDMLMFPAADQEVIDSYEVHQGTMTLDDRRGDPFSANSLLRSMLPWANGPDWYDCD
jgi:hypothetical protein